MKKEEKHALEQITKISLAHTKSIKIEIEKTKADFYSVNIEMKPNRGFEMIGSNKRHLLKRIGNILDQMGVNPHESVGKGDSSLN
jgi:hypothetical protein